MLNIGNENEYSTDSTPTVMISGELDKLGIITAVNSSAASLFGYNKTELISSTFLSIYTYHLLDRKVNTIMANIYSRHHDFFLESYLTTN